MATDIRPVNLFYIQGNQKFLQLIAHRGFCDAMIDANEFTDVGNVSVLIFI